MAVNTLTHLLGDYNSDSEIDESVQQTPTSSNRDITDKLNKFLNEIESESVTNWTQCIDASTGHPYYWNITTKEVTWEIPAEFDEFLKKNAWKFANSANKWALCYSDDQTAYYFNEITREISYEKPDGFIQIQTSNCDKKTISDRKETIKGKSKKTDKRSKKKYPFDEPENEKVELISSYSQEPGSSSDEESGKKVNKKRKTTPSTSTKLNLVPEYNSDDDSEDMEPTIEQKSLFAASCDNAQLNSVQPIKLNPMKMETPNDSTPTPSDAIEKPLKKPKSTFASIITGGRSPQQNSLDLQSIAGPLQPDESAITAELAAIESEHLSQKLFKRKRRIEFNTTQTRAVSNKSSPLENEISGESSSAAALQENNTNEAKPESSYTKSKGNFYSNFQKGESEFTPPNETSENSRDKIYTYTCAQSPEDSLKNEISDLKEVLGAKIKFLCQGRPEISAVQIIQIQLQALMDAYAANAVRSEYILRWLENISTDLTKLESEAAPEEWQCLWDSYDIEYLIVAKSIIV